MQSVPIAISFFVSENQPFTSTSLHTHGRKFSEGSVLHRSDRSWPGDETVRNPQA